MVGKSQGGFDGLCICVSDSMDLRLAFLLHSIAQVSVEIFLFGGVIRIGERWGSLCQKASTSQRCLPHIYLGLFLKSPNL
jgi:hypothetical protein